LFALGAGFGLFLWQSISLFEGNLKDKVIANASLTASFCTTPLAIDDRKGLRHILAKFKDFPEVTQACIYNRRGKIYATYRRNSTQPHSFSAYHKQLLPSAKFQDGFLHVHQPVLYNNHDYLGLVYLKVSTQYLQRQVNREIYILGGLLLLLLVVCYLLARSLQRVVSNPVEELIKIIDQISDKGDYTLRAQRQQGGNDEITKLYAQFNHMLEQIELRQQQEQNSRKKYQGLFLNSVIGIVRIDFNSGNILEANPRFWEMMQLGSVSKLSRDMIQYRQEDLCRLKGQLLQVGVIRQEEVLITLHNQQKVWLSISGRLSPLQQFEGVIQDVTQQKVRSLELKQANHELDNFVYRASHEFRAPLRSILGLANLIKQEQDRTHINDCVDMIVQSTQSLDDVVQNALALTKNKRVDNAFTAINWQTKLQTFLDSLTDFKNNDRIKIDLGVQQNAAFYSDLSRINIIVGELLANSLRFTRHLAQPLIAVDVQADHNKAVLTIKDNGEGIPAEELPKIFDMFYRGSESSQGSGLGLYIVKDALHKLNGSISVETKPQQGTTFRIEIPNQRKPSRAVVGQKLNAPPN
jgi:signal transduction histidine kinase